VPLCDCRCVFVQLELPLPAASGALGTLKLTLVARWLRTFAVGDDDDAGSVFSAMTTNSSEYGAAAGSLEGADEYQSTLGSLKEHMVRADSERRHWAQTLEAGTGW
jgi:hypothetical protein